ITSPQELVLPLTILFVSAAILAGALRLLLLWAQTKLTFAAGSDISNEVFRRTLYQPYPVHLSRNSSEIVSVITNKTTEMMFDILLPSIILINSILVAGFIFSALVIISPEIALSMTIGFGILYALIAVIMSKKLRRQSHIIAEKQTQLVKILQEGLGGIRDVLLDGTQGFYGDMYRETDKPLRQCQAKNLFIGGSPRFIIEALGMGAIALLAYHISLNGGIATALPVLGALALGMQRILPVLQQAYNSWSLITGHHGSLKDALALLNQPMPERQDTGKEPIAFTRDIRLSNVAYRYTPDGPIVLNIPDLLIPRGARVGIAGTTGSGKSTLLDIIMALLPLETGSLAVDGETITPRNCRSWQDMIAHVPQSIFLADSSVESNIAFGISTKQIDKDKVRLAAKQANIDNFIQSLPDGYHTRIGERGARLSGGQRQRIGIARALYRNAKLLILDEATSALDDETEKSVMEAINKLGKELTILIVAHRLSTLNQCDMRIMVEKGHLSITSA
ncbi:MAG: ABC transporter ATP-binding protein, partial [Alphaproteobacteria bacterium]|nr:ABC transporter ATP-binding protein [Alphaproteobacteria bacterium]